MSSLEQKMLQSIDYDSQEQEVNDFFEEHKDNPSLLADFEKIFDEMTFYKDCVVGDLLELNGTLDRLCKLGKVTTKEDEEAIASQLIEMYQQNGY